MVNTGPEFEHSARSPLTSQEIDVVFGATMAMLMDLRQASLIPSGVVHPNDWEDLRQAWELVRNVRQRRWRVQGADHIVAHG